uniref:Uncharacterized protein n=1 Tax=Arundo donax TaxID=35708 RepID=A0A0A8YX44_ARUDO
MPKEHQSSRMMNTAYLELVMIEPRRAG